MTVFLNGNAVVSSYDVLNKTNGSTHVVTALGVGLTLPASPAQGQIHLEIGCSSRDQLPMVTAMEVLRLGRTSLADALALDLPAAATTSPEDPPPPPDPDATILQPALNSWTPSFSPVEPPSPTSRDNPAITFLVVLGAILAAAVVIGSATVVYLCTTHQGRQEKPIGPSAQGLSGNEGLKTLFADTTDQGQANTLQPYEVQLPCIALPCIRIPHHKDDRDSTAVFHFSLKELRSATGNFSRENFIGQGGSWEVYKGTLPNGTPVAVKRAAENSQSDLEFETELILLSKLQSPHLVTLLGVCTKREQKILVYEYMAQGPLQKYLYGPGKTPLHWRCRLEVAIGAAQGLKHLHTAFAAAIIHRNIKTSNILLDESFTAKLSGCGLSRLGPQGSEGQVHAEVAGSFGYIDPEYFKWQQVLEKSDVYSFGVVLLEILCGRPALDTTLPQEEASLAELFRAKHRAGQWQGLVDPTLLGQYTWQSLRLLVETAQLCLHEHLEDRPSMTEVVGKLEGALEALEGEQHEELQSEARD